MPALDLADLLESWETHLEAERKSPNTIRLYVGGVRGFLAWCEAKDRPAVLDRATVNAYVADLLRQGAEPATARARQLALRRFAAWLVEEDELADDPLAGLKPPRLDQKLVPVLDDSQLRLLIKACDGKGLADRRDEAIIRVMLETGIRAGECIALTISDVNVRGGVLYVRRARAARAAWWRSARPRPGASIATSEFAGPTTWPTPRRSGWARAATALPTTASTAPSTGEPRRPASPRSGRTCSGTPWPRAGWPRAAQRAAYSPWRGGRIG